MVCYSYPLSWSIIKISIRKVSRYPFFTFVARVIRLFGTPSLFGHLASYLRSFVFIEALPLYSHRCTNPGASPTRTPYKNTYFFLSRPDWSKAVSDRLKPRTRLRALIKEDEDSDTPTSATTQPSNKWKFGTTTSTPVINGEWKETTSPRRRIGKTIIDLYCSNILTLILSPQREISFGYIDILLRIPESLSTSCITLLQRVDDLDQLEYVSNIGDPNHHDPHSLAWLSWESVSAKWLITFPWKFFVTWFAWIIVDLHKLSKETRSSRSNSVLVS